MSKEVEIKLVALSGVLESSVGKLLGALSVVSFDERWLVNTYFDTAESDLNHQRVALRIRESAGCYIQTLKTKGSNVAGVHSRGEWEWELPSNHLDGSLLNLDAWPEGVQVGDLAPVFETNFKRVSAIIEHGESKIELAIDEGFISAAGKRAPLCEVELEIVEGEVDDLFALAKLVASTIPVVPSNVSKAERGYRLGSEVVSSTFEFEFECGGSYKEYLEVLIDKNLSNWLFLFDRGSQSCSPDVLVQMYGVLSVLSELLSSVGLAESGVTFSRVDLLVSQKALCRGLVEEVVGGVQSLDACYRKLLADKEVGELAIAIGEWLYQRKRVV